MKLLSLRNLLFLAFFLAHGFAFLPNDAIVFPNEKEPLRLYSLEQGDLLQDVVLKVIKEAKRSLNMATYSLTDAKVIKAIKEASDRGVEIVLSVDKNGYKGKREQLGEKTKLIQRGIKGLMHQKWIIQDETLSLIGSANLTWDSLNHQNNLIIAVASKAYAKSLLEEAQKKTFTNLHHQGNTWSTPLPPFQLATWTTPKNNELKKALLQAIDGAKKTIRIAMYTFTEKELLEKVVDAKKRGVDVRVALDKGQSLGVCFKVFQRLLQEAVPVALSVGKPLLHHKFIWIDQEKFFTGSFNWTKAALTQNEELLTLFEGGKKSDPFWKGLDITWKELEKHVEWQKYEDWVDRVRDNGASACQNGPHQRAYFVGDYLSLAA